MRKLAPISFKDESQLTVDYQGTVQRSLNYGIASLDNNNKFNPKAPITRGVATEWVFNAIKVLEKHQGNPEAPEAPEAPANGK